MLAAAALTLLALAAAPVQSSLVDTLQAGGHVVVMRHGQAPAQPPPPGTADPANVRGERQLDEQGRRAVVAMGEAARSRAIRFAPVLTSPTYRARQTAGLAGLQPQSQPELGDGAGSMTAAATGAEGDAWLRAQVRIVPQAGNNALLITHGPNIVRAFPGPAVAEGEALVFRPDGRGGTTELGRIKIEEWTAR